MSDKNDSTPESVEEKTVDSTEEVVAEKIVTENVVPAVKGKWYVLHSQTGHENRVKNNLEQRIQSLGVENKIFDIIVPTREVVVIKKGKKTKQKEKVFPGYIFVRMDLDDESWLVVRTTEGVTGFIGAGTKPTPISDKEVQAIMKFVTQEQPKFKAKFSVGEAVKITEGPFADFLGSIEAIDEEKGKIRVLVSIFDRETPVELDFLQVKKL
jgi:transcriptional antiterminator NusG